MVSILFWSRQSPVGYSLEEPYVLPVSKIVVIASVEACVSGYLLKSFLEIQRDVLIFSIEERLGLWGHFPCGHGHDDSKGRCLLHSMALGGIVFPAQVEHPPVPLSHGECFGLIKRFHLIYLELIEALFAIPIDDVVIWAMYKNKILSAGHDEPK